MTATGLESQGDDGRAAPVVHSGTTPENAARRLFQNPRAIVDFSAGTLDDAKRAVEEFARLFETAPGVFKEALEGARAGAETLSGDRLQGLAEIIQNADDAGASHVRFQVVGNNLIAAHDGKDVTLSDVLALATPWLSNKADNDLTTGRFGIGLMTLRALSSVLDVHSGPYHIRLGAPTIAAIEPASLLFDHPKSGATALCLPLPTDALSTDDIATWLDRWDDSALLFLRSVRYVAVVGPTGEPVRTLRLEWHDDQPAHCRVAGHNLAVRRRHATAPDGRRWLVHATEASRPPDVRRVRKAAGATVPLGLACALQPGDHGVIYAGLPIVQTGVPLRVNAQFDPITSRTGLAPTKWNSALLPLLADLWVEVAEDLLAEQPIVAWDVIPLPHEHGADDDSHSVVAQFERLLLDRARKDLVTRAALVVEGKRVRLTDLAVEERALEGIIEPSEVARLAGLATPLPASARDGAGRWREVLDDWRRAGAPLPDPVTVDDALTLLNDSGRSVDATIALTAVALHEGLAASLATLPCVSTSDGQRIIPPTANSVQVLMVNGSRLTEDLGMGVALAPEHLAEAGAATTVLAWLREIGAVIDHVGDEEVVRRLASAGRAGECLSRPLTDEQLRALRDAVEQLPPTDRSSLARDVGQAITIAALRYSTRGQVERLSARPALMYLSRAIDREQDSFAVAADKTPGLLWTDNRYAEQLRSSRGRVGGLGPQKFLGLLGVERAPRIVPNADLEARYIDRRLGLPLGAPGSPPQRDRELRALGASYTLDDLDSPDLRAVVVNIAAERNPARRRGRAGALLGALGRAWDRLADGADVIAAQTDYGWRSRGNIKAFWLWSVGATAWLDDTNGVPQPPIHLRLKTPGTVAVHGADAPGYLRPEFDAPNRREVLAALGVSGEPTTRDLVARLGSLRELEPAPKTIDTDAAILYQAIADRLDSSIVIPGDLSERELRAAFGDGDGLIHTDLGWRRPTQVLGGDPIFGRRHAFVPQVPRAERLWRTLHIRQPSAEDCLRVIGRVARTRRAPEGDDVLVLLESLRRLAERLVAMPEVPRRLTRRLASLSLWTTRGWTRTRPVYAVDDPALVEGLRAEVPVWEPGGDVSQFESLLGPLRITRLGADATTVVDRHAAAPDDDAADLFGAAVSQLQDDLARNDPRAAGALALGWDRLREFDVRVNPDLRVRIEGLIGRPPVEVEVATKADPTAGVLYVRDSRLLGQVDGGGRAVAGLFAGADQRHLAQAWLAACVAVEHGRAAQGLRLAAEKAAEERERRAEEMKERTAALGQEIAGRHEGGTQRRPRRGTGSQVPARGGAPSDGVPQPPPPPPPRPRVLVDPGTLVVLNPRGRSGDGPREGARTRQTRRESSPLPQPNRTTGAPRGGTSAPGFTQLDKESVGMDLACMVLAGDEDEIVDLRAQHRVGADAVDSLDRFFELKVHLGDEPDVIRLEESEIRRALSTPDFFLVVVSNIEGPNARPKVRIIVDPVHQLSMAQSSSVSFTGVRSAEHSLVYDLGPEPDSDDQG